jgi:3-isopropylmalate dehydrogenase
MVSCVDKSNVFRSYAFFRKIFNEKAEANPDITPDYRYVDAMALDLVRKPWDYDVLVAENMFADILSDLGGGIIGGMGMAPCAEIGENHALFQPSHGTAPDIAGTGQANPTAMVLSAAMMLDWLSDRHGSDACKRAALILGQAVEQGFASGKIQPAEFGGPQGTQKVTDAVIEIIEK